MARVSTTILIPLVFGIGAAIVIHFVGSVLYSYEKLTHGKCGVTQERDRMGFEGELFCE